MCHELCMIFPANRQQQLNGNKVMIYKTILLTIVSFFCININAFPAQFHPNPLQAQAMQTQEFQATKRKVFDAVMTVFQNNGYMVQDSDYNSGYISARRAGAQGVSVTATITSSKKGKDTFSKVRLSYVTPRSQVYDPSFYQQVFNDIRQQLFVGDAMP